MEGEGWGEKLAKQISSMQFVWHFTDINHRQKIWKLAVFVPLLFKPWCKISTTDKGKEICERLREEMTDRGKMCKGSQLLRKEENFWKRRWGNGNGVEEEGWERQRRWELGGIFQQKGHAGRVRVCVCLSESWEMSSSHTRSVMPTSFAPSRCDLAPLHGTPPPPRFHRHICVCVRGEKDVRTQFN